MSGNHHQPAFFCNTDTTGPAVKDIAPLSARPRYDGIKRHSKVTRERTERADKSSNKAHGSRRSEDWDSINKPRCPHRTEAPARQTWLVR